jgi:hypothetical protein
MCDIHVIDIYHTSAQSNIWVFNTGSIAHIYSSQEVIGQRCQIFR